jgi:ABC-type dipeptide/oligopeptide/nickel transport system permease component
MEINKEEFLEWLDEHYPFVQNFILPTLFILAILCIILGIGFYINDTTWTDYLWTTVFLIVSLGTTYSANKNIMSNYIKIYKDRIH